MTERGAEREKVLIVVPALNEKDHIAGVMDSLLLGLPDHRVSLTVADGGSIDGTTEIVLKRAATDDRVRLLRNTRRRQAPGINLAVESAGEAWDYLIRADAHASYPPEYCATLLKEARDTGAAAVAVPLRTVGRTSFSRGAAAAQNSFLGTGGAAHRMGRGGRFVDHGHHALIRLDAFRDVRGYDPGFAHNEDAELDYRLNSAGHRIWLTDRTQVEYYPRETLGALARQYFDYGLGRARMLAKHGLRPRFRQVLPVIAILSTLLALAGLLLAAMLWSATPLILAAPAAGWIGICLVAGCAMAIRARDPSVLWAGVAAIAMHASWGLGFLRSKLPI